MTSPIVPQPTPITPQPTPIIAQPGRLTFYLRPNVFARPVGDLADDPGTEGEQIAAKLNENLRAQLLTAIGPGKPGVTTLVKGMTIDFRQSRTSDLTTVIR